MKLHKRYIFLDEQVIFPLSFKPEYAEPIEAHIWDEEQQYNEEWLERHRWRERRESVEDASERGYAMDPGLAAILGYAEDGDENMQIE